VPERAETHRPGEAVARRLGAVRRLHKLGAEVGHRLDAVEVHRLDAVEVHRLDAAEVLGGA
jgi:hypothetical protein